MRTTTRRDTRTIPDPVTLAVVVGILRQASEFNDRVARLLEPFGITPQQYNVLRILRGAGEPLPTMEIGERMIEKTPGITRLLERTVRKGWVKRERCAGDGRRVLCSITSAGRGLLRRLDRPMARLDESLVAALTPTERRRMAALLGRLEAPQAP